MKHIVWILIFTGQLAFAQTWSNFTYMGDNEKTNFDVDESTVRVNTDILTLWVRARPKDSSTLFFATLDKLNIKCTDYQYAVSIRKSVDKDGKILREFFDLPDAGLKWANTAESSIARRIAVKYCKAPSQSVKLNGNEEGWLSLGQNENSEFTYFVNPSKNKIIGEELTYSGKIVYANEQKNAAGKAYKTILNENVINCRNSTYATTKNEIFNSSNVLVDSNGISKEFAIFRPMTPTSFAGRIREKYCDPTFLSSNDRRDENKTTPTDKRLNVLVQANEDEDKCEKLGFKKATPPFERCIKQLRDAR